MYPVWNTTLATISPTGRLSSKLKFNGEKYLNDYKHMWFYITLINSLSNSIVTIFFSIYFLDRSELKKKRRLE